MHETSRKDGIHLDFMATIKRKIEQWRKQTIYVDNLMKNTNIEEWKTTISDAR